jgi:hypothetical protein
MLSMSKKQKVIDTVLTQQQPFHSSTITSLSGTSVALVSNTLNEMLEQGRLSSRKDGKKIVYSVTGDINTIDPNVPVQSTQPDCTVAEKFDYIRDIVRMVVAGVNPSALITGRAGVGKTHLVREEMKHAGLREDEDYIFVSGHSAAFGLYKLLHDHREQFIIFDDCDSVFKCPRSINVLKSALDSYDTRRVSWVSSSTENKEDLDSHFDFEGRIIFISNYYAHQIDSAVCSRSFCMDLHMTNREVTEHMENLLEDIEPTVDVNIKREVLEYLDSISDNFKSYGLRSLIQATRIRMGCAAGNDWKKMVKMVTANA